MANRRACKRARSVPAQDGPSDIWAAMRWPETLLQDVQDADGRQLEKGSWQRLMRHLRTGLVASSSFSGMGGDIFGVIALARAAAQLDIDQKGESPGAATSQDPSVSGVRRAVCFTSATDVRPVCQRILAAYTVEDRPRHIFGDIMGRLPPSVQALLERVGPAADSDPQFYESQFDAVMEVLKSSPSAFAVESEDWCHLHQRRCPVYSASEHGRLTLHWAGTICIDFSVMGLERGAFGPYSVLFAIWVQERLARKETLWFHECTPAFPEALLHRHLGGDYWIYTVEFGPENLGWWVQRPRKFSIGVLKCAGALVNDIAAFPEVFFKARAAGAQGEMFFCAPADMLLTEFDRRRQRALALRLQRQSSMDPSGMTQEPTSADIMSWRDLLEEGDRRRLGLYERGADMQDDELVLKILQDADGDIAEGDAVAALSAQVVASRGPAIVNVSQTFEQKGGSVLNGSVPTLLTRSRLWSLRQSRPMLGWEYLLCQGMPAMSSEMGFGSPSPFDAQTFDERDLRFCAGNAIHSACSGALVAFALSSLELSG